MSDFITTLESCGYIVHSVKTKQEALLLSQSMIKKGMSVGLGGSTSVDEIGLLSDLIKREDITLFNQYEAGISMDENKDRRRKGMLTDIFVTGTNALTRDGKLVNADGSITLPQSFIPPAERYDLMPQVDRWVIEYAFSNIDKNTNYSINLSGLSTCDPTLADFIESLSQIHVIDARRITFEITETAAIQNIAKCLGLIGRLKALGFKFSLDDFGSGLSSFTYLKNLTIDYLKIDGSFVKEIAHDSASYAMVKSINEVGHAMGLETIAEFVENQSILNKLQEIGVDYVQGYHIHKPEQLKSAHPSS